MHEGGQIRVSLPNLKHVVQSVRDLVEWDFSTQDGLCAYSGAVVTALHATDPDFVYLKKKKPKNGCYPPGANEGRAVDAVLYLPTGQAVDFIINAGPGSANAVTWGTEDPVGKYGPEDGFAPTSGTPIPTPGTPPDPPPAVDLAPILTRLTLLETRAGLLWEVYSELAKHIGIINQQIADLTNKPTPPLPDHKHSIGWLTTSGPK